MQQIDFTKPGGLPFSQDILRFMQDSFKQMINVVAQLGKTALLGSNVAMKLVGMASLGGGNYSEGWFLYNGEVIYFPAQNTGSVPGGFTRFLVIDIIPTTLTYYNGTTPDALTDKTCHFQNFTTGTPEDGTKFIWASLTSW